MKLYKDFGYDDDTVITTLERSMEELKRAKLDYPGPPMPNELPQQPFGKFTEPTFERKVGRRAEEFTAKENATKAVVQLRREKAAAEVAATTITQRDSHVSVGDNSSGLAGTESVDSSDIDSHDNSSIFDRYDSDIECTRL